jgi:hypothetical protein
MRATRPIVAPHEASANNKHIATILQLVTLRSKRTKVKGITVLSGKLDKRRSSALFLLRSEELR